MKKYLFFLLFIFSSALLFSHPHVFIDINIEVEDLSSANIKWTFDPIESENKIYFFDNNADGTLSSSEINDFYNEGFKSISDYNYFIITSNSGLQYPVKEISDFKALIEDDGRLSVLFKIELPEMNADDKKLSITHFDTSYFISFSDPNIQKLGLGLYSSVLKNTSKPFYYDPNATKDVTLDTSNPQKGWIKTFPTELFISTEPLLNSFKDYKITYKERFLQLQRFVYIKLSKSLIKIKDGTDLFSVLWILLFSLLYGVIHAVGPGHRKIVISSYVLSKNINYFRAIGISFLSALIHSGSGVFIIIILNLLFSQIRPLFLVSLTGNLEVFSFISILVLSLILILIKVIKTSKKEILRNSNNNIVSLSIIILSSIVPCPGAVTIMLFSLSLGMVYIGLWTVLAMSIGIGVTLAVISVITLKGKQLSTNSSSGLLKHLKVAIEWIGLLVMLLFSLFMLLSLN